MDSPFLPGRVRRRIAQRTVLLLALLHGPGAGSLADDATAVLPPPEGPVLLVIRGAIARTNVDDEARFDRAMLHRLPRTGFETATPWSTAPSHTFEGVRLSVLLDLVGASGTRFEAIGADDYAITFEGVDLERYPVILADTQDGMPLTLRRLGPLRIMFPFDDYPELLNQGNDALSVWQLEVMEIR